MSDDLNEKNLADNIFKAPKKVNILFIGGPLDRKMGKVNINLLTPWHRIMQANMIYEVVDTKAYHTLKDMPETDPSFNKLYLTARYQKPA